MDKKLTSILLLLGPSGSGKSFFIKYKLKNWLSASVGLPVAEEIEEYKQTSQVDVYVESLTVEGNTLHIVLPDLPGEELESQLRSDSIPYFDVRKVKGKAKAIKDLRELDKLCKNGAENSAKTSHGILKCIAGIICNMINRYDRIVLLFLYTPEARPEVILDMFQALIALSMNVAEVCSAGSTAYFDIVLVFNKLDMVIKSISVLNELEYSIMLAPFTPRRGIQIEKRITDIVEKDKLCTFARLLDAGATVLGAKRVSVTEEFEGFTYYQSKEGIGNVVFRLTAGYSYKYEGQNGKHYIDRLFTPYLVKSIVRPEGYLLPPAPLVTLPFTHLVTNIGRNYCSVPIETVEGG